MMAKEPQSTAAVLAVCLIVALATAAPAQVLSPARPQRVTASPTGERPAGNTHRYGILGPVQRAGVYISLHDDLTLAELTTAAGGTTSPHSVRAQVIRRGQVGPRLSSAAHATAPLAPGDIVVLEPTAGTDTHTAREWIGLGLVGILPEEPVVVLLPASPAPTLAGLIAMLQQSPGLIDTVRVVRTSSQPPGLVNEAPQAPLREGDVVVFDPAAIDRAALARAPAFPPPVLVTARQKREPFEMVIQPLPRLSAAAPGSSAQEELSTQIRPLRNEPVEIAEQTSRPRPVPSEPAATDLADAARPSPLREAQLDTRPADTRPAERGPEANLRQIAAASPSVVVTALVETSEVTPRSNQTGSNQTGSNQTGGRETASNQTGSNQAGVTVLSPSPQSERIDAPGRMPEVTLAGQLAQQMAPRPSARRQTAARPTSSAKRSGLALTAAQRSPVRTESASSKSDSSAGSGPPSLGMRALTVGVTVLATALICFAVSLLWSRLVNATGLSDSPARPQSEPLPMHSRTGRDSTLQGLINNSLPIIEEPMSLPERADYHGEAVGRRRLRIDTEQNLSGPHHAVPQTSAPQVVASAAAQTANTRSNREVPSAGTLDGAATRSPALPQAAEGGLLDRVLVAMERERRR